MLIESQLKSDYIDLNQLKTLEGFSSSVFLMFKIIFSSLEVVFLRVCFRPSWSYLQRDERQQQTNAKYYKT